MIEAAILLHQDHDMIDILDRAAADIGGDGQRPRDRCRESGRRCGTDAAEEKFATLKIGHRWPRQCCHASADGSAHVGH
jgi:hypothetical protein